MGKPMPPAHLTYIELRTRCCRERSFAREGYEKTDNGSASPGAV